ncbi:MAG: hypothetical protein MJY89_04170 [Bacteroidales bacterium]|nr:hypothetical protein [Bacteroidales bacterium]
MDSINVFIAGAKGLDTYRQNLVLWANGKNYVYRKKKVDLQLNFYSFQEVGDDQDIYNTVITEETDIFLLIVEGSIGTKSKEELEKAKNARANRGRPEIWVFANNVDVNTNSYLEGSLGRKYYVDFESPEELVNKVSTRIDKYVHSIMLQSVKSRKSKLRKLWVYSIFACLVSLFAGWFVGKQNDGQVKEKIIEDKPMLLIAGGGSVANFIEEQAETMIPSLADYSNGYYVHLPTKSAWKMLVEEVISLQDTRRYYPVCISAAKATDEDFLNAQISQKMYLDSAIIVSGKLGEDSLAVYIQEGCKFLKENPQYTLSKRISVEQLKKILLSHEMNVYSTSVESGTRAGYCKAFGLENVQLGEYLAGQFSENSPLSSISIGNKPYLLLGSKYYGMDSAKNDAIRLIVQSDYVKPMMVYFMAYRASGDIYKIPRETMEFLNHLNFHTLDEYISSDGSIKIKNHNHVIYDEDNLFENTSK